MAKRVNSISLKGLLHEDNQLEEFNVKTETSELFDLVKDTLPEFHGKTVLITIKEESKAVESTTNSASYDVEDEDEDEDE